MRLPSPWSRAVRSRSRPATPSTSSTSSPSTTHHSALFASKSSRNCSRLVAPSRVGAATRGVIRSRAVRSFSWNTLAIMAASSASIWPFWEPSRASRRISSSSVLISFSAVIAGSRRSSSSTRGSIRLVRIAKAGALARATGRARRLPRALGRISPSRITSTVSPTENRGRATPSMPSRLKTMAA